LTPSLSVQLLESVAFTPASRPIRQLSGDDATAGGRDLPRPGQRSLRDGITVSDRDWTTLQELLA
jgi:hypothetical protein